MKNAEQNGAEHEKEVAAPEAHPVGLPRLAQPVSDDRFDDDQECGRVGRPESGLSGQGQRGSPERDQAMGQRKQRRDRARPVVRPQPASRDSVVAAKQPEEQRHRDGGQQ